jgi:hypothetical protein
MNKLRVAVVVKNRVAAFSREERPMGMWSYFIPEFQWDFLYLGKEFVADTASYAKTYDFIFHEDGGNWGQFKGNALPILYHVIDSTLSEKHHYLPRFEQAKQASLILVDHDRLERFAGTGRKVVRFEYCINDKVFKDYELEKTTDVAFHCGGSEDRQKVRVFLHDLCRKQRWTYTSGVLPLFEYAKAMNRAKITVNWPRAEGNRPHRVFDAIACWSRLLTAPIPENTQSHILPGNDYTVFRDTEDLEDKIADLLARREWVWRTGSSIVHEYHTWAARARQLRELVKQEFGL